MRGHRFVPIVIGTDILHEAWSDTMRGHRFVPMVIGTDILHEAWSYLQNLRLDAV
jgi:hypothetical protein